MHEMSIATGILEIIEDAARRQNFQRVTVIHIEIGALAGVAKEALLFCLEVILLNTCARGAKLELELIPGQGHCPKCNYQALITAIYDPCPQCGSYPLHIIGGTELRVKDLLVE